MKTKIFKLIFAFALIVPVLIATTSCKDEKYIPGEEVKDEGTLDLGSLNLSVSVGDEKISRADAPAVNLDDFDVRVEYATNGVLFQRWKYKDLPEIITLPVATYRIKVSYGEMKPVEWENPVYEGSQEFKIERGKIVKVENVICKLINIKVTVSFADNLKDKISEDAKVVVEASESGTHITFGPEHIGKSAAYFQAVDESRTLVATLTYQHEGQTQTVHKSLTNIKAGQHFHIEYEYKSSTPDIPAETGTVSRGPLNIDVTVYENNIKTVLSPGETVLPGDDRPNQETPLIPDNPDNPNPPVEPIVPKGEGDFDISKVNTPEDGKNYVVNIHSDNGFSSLKVNIISKSLNKEMLEGVGLSDEFDLATPGALKDALVDSFHFPVGEQITGDDVKDVKFNITEFVPLLLIYPDETHTFRLTITDKNGNEKVVDLVFQT